MTDIILYPKSAFLDIKDSVKASDSIRNKYEELFNSNECFQNTIYVSTTKFPSKKEQHMFKSIQGKSLNNSQDVKRKIFIKAIPIKKAFQSNEKHHIKKCKCILNVINEVNYTKQLSKLKFIIDKDTIDDIVRILIDTSILQIFYIGLFIRLMKDLGYIQKIREHVTQYAQSFFDTKLVYQSSLHTTNEYDEFCNMQKHKTLCISTCKMIFICVQNELCDVSYDTFVKYITIFIETYKENQFILDILLNIICECKKINKKFIDSIPYTLFVDLTPTYSSKIQFLLKDIYEKY